MPSDSSKYTKALADKYYRQITGGGEARPAGPGARLSAPAGPIGQSDVSVGGGKSFLEQLGDPSTGVGKVVDVLSQPLYATVEASVRQAAAGKKLLNGEGGVSDVVRLLSPGGNLLTSFGTGNEKKTASDVLRGDKDLMNRVAEDSHTPVRFTEDIGPLAAKDTDTYGQIGAKFTAGLAADIAADPTTYIPGAAISAVGRQIPRAALQGAKGLEKVAADGSRTAKLAQDAQEFIYRFGKVKRPETKGPDLGDITDAEILDEVPVGAVRQADEVIGEVVPDAIPSRQPTLPNAGLLPSRPEVPRTPEGAIPMPAGPAAEAAETAGETATLFRNAETGEIRPNAPMVRRYSDDLLDQYRQGPWRDNPNYVEPIRAAAQTDEVIEAPTNVARETARRVKLDPKQDRAAFAAYAESTPEFSRQLIDDYFAGEVQGRRSIAELRALASQRPAAIAQLRAAGEGFRLQGAALDDFIKQSILGAREALDVFRTKHPTAPWRAPAEAAETARAARTAAEASGQVAGRPRASQARQTARARAAAQAREEAARTAAARDRRAAAIRYNRGNFAYRNWANKIVQDLDIEDAIALIAAKTGAEYDDVLKGLSEKVLPDSKSWEPYVVPVLRAEPVNVEGATAAAQAGNQFAAPAATVETAAEQMAKAPAVEDDAARAARIDTANGAGLSDETLAAVERAGAEQQIIKRGGTTPKSGGQPWKYQTNRGAARTSARPGEGFGRNKSLNRYWQMNMVSELIASPSGKAIRDEMTAALKALDEAGLDKVARGRAAAKIYRDANEAMARYVIPELRKIEDAFIANGNWPHAAITRGGIPLRMTQVYDALSQTNLGRALITNRMFNPRGGGRIFGKTSLTTDAQRARGVASVEPIMRIAEHIVNMAVDPLNLVKAENIGEEIAKISKQIVADMANKGELRAFMETALMGKYEGRPIPGIATSRAGGKWEQVTAAEAKAVVDQVAEAFQDTRVLQLLLQSAHTNAAQAGVQFGHAVKGITTQAYEQIITKLDDTTGAVTTGEKMESIADVKSVVDDTPIAKEDPAVGPAEKAAAQQVVEENLTEVVPPIDIKVAEIALRSGKPSFADEFVDSAQAVRNAVDNGNEKYVDVVVQALDENPTILLEDFQGISYAMQTGIFRMLDGLASRFVNHYGNATLHTAAIIPHVKGGNMREAMQAELRATESKARELAAARGVTSKDIWKEAFDAVKAGTRDVLPAEMKEFGDNVAGIMDYIFAVPKADGEPQSILSLFQREGFDFDHINTAMSNPRYKISENFRFQKKVDGKSQTMRELSEQWRAWDVEDPLDFLAKMERVANDLATETAISREAWRIGNLNNMMSTKPKAGFYKVPRTEGSVVMRYLPYDNTGHVYMNKQALQEIRRMDDILSSRKDTPWNKFVSENIEPILSIWKFGMTVLRPGHHIRNVVGDSSMAFLHSGLKDPKYYIRSVKMLQRQQNAMGRTFRGDYGGWDAMAALQGINRMEGHRLADILAANGGVDGPLTVAARIKQGENVTEVDPETLFRGLMDRGALPNFRQQEDIIDDLTNENAITHRIARGTRWKGSAGQATQKKVSQKIGRFTEGRDDFIRQAHAMHLLEHGIQGKAWKKTQSLDDIFDEVAAEIRRAHPDGTDLTPFEKNNMRLLFPFYSWTRKAIPLVVENMLTHPGRFMVYPKAMYNFAQAQGIDLESMSEPFPEDQVFPNFLRENMTGVSFQTGEGLFSRPNEAGTDRHYWTANPGVVQADVLNSFAPTNNPAGSIRGILGMLNPALKVPAELASGVNIGTGVPISDKSDYVDQQIPGLNSINSVTGISPTGTIATGQVDYNRQRAKGNREGTADPEYMLNYLLGQQLYDTTKPNLVRLGQMDMRDFIKKLTEQQSA